MIDSYGALLKDTVDYYIKSEVEFQVWDAVQAAIRDAAGHLTHAAIVAEVQS